MSLKSVFKYALSVITFTGIAQNAAAQAPSAAQDPRNRYSLYAVAGVEGAYQNADKIRMRAGAVTAAIGINFDERKHYNFNVSAEGTAFLIGKKSGDLTLPPPSLSSRVNGSAPKLDLDALVGVRVKMNYRGQAKKFNWYAGGGAGFQMPFGKERTGLGPYVAERRMKDAALTLDLQAGIKKGRYDIGVERRQLCVDEGGSIYGLYAKYNLFEKRIYPFGKPKPKF